MMGMFTENRSGERCSDCLWADNMEGEIDKYKKLLENTAEYFFNLGKLAHKANSGDLLERCEIINSINETMEKLSKE